MKRFISASLSVCLVLVCSGFESLALIQDEDVPQETVELVTDGEEVDSDEASDEAASDEEETAPAEPSETEAATEAEPTETEAEPTESEPVETEAVVTEAPEETEQAQEEETTPAETSEITEEVLPEVTEEKTEEVVSANEEIQSSDIKDEMPEEPVKYIAWDGETMVNVFENELIKVTFTLINTWNGGYSANVKIENLSDANIENWGVAFTSLGELSTLWNGVIESDEDGIIIVKNAEWNQDIPAGGSVDFGLTGKEDFKAFPGEYKILGDICLVEKSEYSVSYSVVSEWEEGFTAGITLTNLSGKQIEDWTLEFDYNRNIVEIWNAEIVSHEDNHYVIKNAGHNANIKAGMSTEFGFNGEDGTSEDIPSGFKLTYITTGTAKPTSKPTSKPTVTPTAKPTVTPTPVVTEEPIVTDVPVVLPRVEIGYTDGDSQYNVKHNLILPTVVGEATVSWISSDESVVSSTGVVNRPYEESVLVTLTATVTNGDSISEETFEVRVIKDMFDYVSPDEIMILDEDVQLYYYNPVVADLKVYKNDYGFIKRIQGSISDIIVDSPDEAMLAIHGVHKLLGMEDAYAELSLDRVAKNTDSYVFVFYQVHNGVKVLGSSVSLTTDMSGNVISLLNNYKPIDISTDPVVSKDEAIANIPGLATYGDAQLNILLDGDVATLIWRVEYITSSGDPWLAYVNAADGSVISNNCTITYSNGCVAGNTDTGIDGNDGFPIIRRTEDGLYYLQDSSRKIVVCSYIGEMTYPEIHSAEDFELDDVNMIHSNTKDGWDQIDTNPYKSTISILDHYKGLRSDIMGKGAYFYIFTRMNEPQAYHKADDSEHYMSFGFLNNDYWSDNPKTVGHEFSHGIVSANSGLETASQYSESRAIDEAYADMFSYLWLNTDDWSISFPNGDRRSSVNPIADGIPDEVPSNYDDYKNGKSEDHYASTMISHIGYNLKVAGMGQRGLEAFLLDTLPSLNDGGKRFEDLKDIWLTVAENRNLTSEYVQIIIDGFEAIGFPTEEPEDFLSNSYATGKVREAAIAVSGLIHYDLADVNVSVERVNDSSFRVNPTVTDDDGVYRFSQLLPGKYKFTFTKNGYVSGVLTYSVFNNNSNYIDNMDLIKVVNAGEPTTGYARGKVFDSVSGSAISGLTVKVRSGWGNTSYASAPVTTVTTNSSGVYELRDLTYGYYTLEVCDKRSNVTGKYRTTFENIVVFGNNRTASGQDVPITKSLSADQIRIVLEWDANPSDLHSHLLGSTNRFKLTWSYRQYPSGSNTPYATLDHDDVDGNGPETTTIFVRSEDEYDFFVYNWTNSIPLTESNATVKVYFGFKEVPTYVFNVPRDGSGRYWNVFKYNPDDGENLETINTIVSVEPTI